MVNQLDPLFGDNDTDLRVPKGIITLPDGRRVFLQVWKPTWAANDLAHVRIEGILQGAVEGGILPSGTPVVIGNGDKEAVIPLPIGDCGHDAWKLVMVFDGGETLRCPECGIFVTDYVKGERVFSEPFEAQDLDPKVAFFDTEMQATLAIAEGKTRTLWLYRQRDSGKWQAFRRTTVADIERAISQEITADRDD